MIHRMLRYCAGWEWHVVQQASLQPQEQKPLPSRKSIGRPVVPIGSKRKNQMTESAEELPQLEEPIAELKSHLPECVSWIDECQNRFTNHISVDELPGIGPLLFGTLLIQLSGNSSDVQPFHFWLTKQRLVTIHDDMRIPLRLQSSSHTLKYNECQIAPEAFFIMISILMDTIHSGLDSFEQKLGELEQMMLRSRNSAGLLDVLIERRYDLMHWGHLFLPIQELHNAAKESFTGELAEKDASVRMTHRLNRIESLLNHYTLEIDSLISIDDAVSSFRRKDILKTLTVFTVLFLPATIAGTIMGSGLYQLPFLNHPWGMTIMLTAAAVMTIGLYIWLWNKGWTSQVLNKQGKPLPYLQPSELNSRANRHGIRNKQTKSVNSIDNRALSTESSLRSRKNRI